MMRLKGGRAAGDRLFEQASSLCLAKSSLKRTGAVNKHLTCIFSQSIQKADSTLVLMIEN